MTRFLALALCVATSLSGADSFRFGPFSLEAAAAGLIDRFPRSSHEFQSPEGKTASLTHNSSDLRDLIAHGTGRYAIRVRPEEAQERVFYVDVTLDRGVAKTIRLSLESPAGVSPALDTRQPACAPILAELTRRYSKPVGPEMSNEEALESRKYVWKTAAEQMSLVCGRYGGRTRVFAMDVTLSRQ